MRPSPAVLLGDPRAVRALRWAARLVLAAALVSCVARGADQPADPVLGDPSATTALPLPTAPTGG